MRLDLVIRGGTVVTASEEFVADVGVAEGRIVAVARDLPKAAEEVDAAGLLVMPGGVDAHCHVDEPEYLGARLADDFASATRAAACGGTTTIMPFANQLPGLSLREAVEDYHGRAKGKALIDYAFHLILSNVSAPLIGQELPALIADGYRSFKVFMTYPGYMLDDRQILEVMDAARRGGATTMVHAENGHCVHWLAQRLESNGQTGLGAFAQSAPPAVEREATHRAIALAEITGTKVMIVHVSSAEALEQIRWGQERGISVMAETCPQYLLGLGHHLHEPGWEAAKHVCSPPPRGAEDAEQLWRGLQQGAFQLVSSDHCPYRFAGSDGKRSQGGQQPHFRKVPPGLPGLETRLPLLYHEGVTQGRITRQQFVALTATNPARVYGLHPRKGSLMPGADADIALWKHGERRAIRHADLHDECDHTPYEGRDVSAWPIVTFSRGEKVWDRGWVSTAAGRGRHIDNRSPS